MWYDTKKTFSQEVRYDPTARLFEKNFTLSPDYCGASARMSPLAAFTMFQAIAAEHAERIGVGGAAMARRGAFWLTLHSRVDFFPVARFGAGGDGGHMAGALRGRSCAASAATACGREISCWRWAAPSGRCWGEGAAHSFAQSGFPEDFPFVEREGITGGPRPVPGRPAAGGAGAAAYGALHGHRHGPPHEQCGLCAAVAGLLPGQRAGRRGNRLHGDPLCRSLLRGEELSVLCRREGSICRMAVRKPDGKTAVLAAVRFHESK